MPTKTWSVFDNESLYTKEIEFTNRLPRVAFEYLEGYWAGWFLFGGLAQLGPVRVSTNDDPLGIFRFEWTIIPITEVPPAWWNDNPDQLTFQRKSIYFNGIPPTPPYSVAFELSDETTISGVNRPVTVKIESPEPGESIFINGTDTGLTETTAGNGQRVAVKVAILVAPDSVVNRLITIGGLQSVFTIVCENGSTLQASQYPSLSQLIFLFNQDLDSDVTSDTFSVYTPSPVSASLSTGSFIVNGVDVGPSTTLLNEDSVQVKLHTSAAYNTPTQAIITIGDILYIFYAVTDKEDFLASITYPYRWYTDTEITPNMEQMEGVLFVVRLLTFRQKLPDFLYKEYTELGELASITLEYDLNPTPDVQVIKSEVTDSARKEGVIW